MARNAMKHIVHKWGGAISYQFMMVLNPPFVIPTKKMKFFMKKIIMGLQVEGSP